MSDGKYNIDVQGELSRIEEFYKTVVSSMNSALAIIGSNHALSFANDSFYKLYGLDRHTPNGIRIDDVLPATMINGIDVRDRIRSLRPGDSPLEFRGLKLYPSPHDEQTINVHASPIVAGDERSVLLLIDNVTVSTKRANQVSMLKKIIDTIQGTLEMDRLFHVILTCVTAGAGLGFSRAILLLVSDDGERLVGEMGVGPACAQEASDIWAQMSRENKTIDEMIVDGGALARRATRPLHQMARSLTLSMHDYSEIAVVATLEKKVKLVRNASRHPAVSAAFRRLLSAEEFVIVPITARDNAVGVIVADNAFQDRPIDEEAVELLTAFANQAGLAIENAKTYESLKDKMKKLHQAYTDLSETQDKLIKAQRLAMIGELAARIAHEIRNPLVTIGGFARTLKKYHDEDDPGAGPKREQIRHNLDIIIDEVMALEEILAKVIDFSRPDKPLLRPGNVNRALEDTIELLKAGPMPGATVIEERFQADLPDVYIDVRQIRQVFFNILQNAIDAMPNGGRVTVTTCLKEGGIEIAVQDEGEGVPPEQIDALFSPFFTTKIDGTGLGLAVVRKIVSDHGGRIRVNSERERGTAFVVTLPCITTPPKEETGSTS